MAKIEILDSSCTFTRFDFWAVVVDKNSSMGLVVALFGFYSWSTCLFTRKGTKLHFAFMVSLGNFWHLFSILALWPNDFMGKILGFWKEQAKGDPVPCYLGWNTFGNSGSNFLDTFHECSCSLRWNSLSLYSAQAFGFCAH